jgi:glycogen debranching enzyme
MRGLGLTNEDANKTYHYICQILLTQANHIDDDPWRGLPELTNDSEYPHLKRRLAAMRGR